MSKDLLLGIDIGTSAGKTGIFDLYGNTIASSTAEYPTARPYSGWAEQNAEDWWTAVRKMVGHMFEGSRIEPVRIAGIGVSNMSTTVLPVDRHGIPVRPAIVWPDTRSTEECEWLRKNIGQEKFSAISHNIIGTFCGLPKLLWFRNHQADLFAKTQAFLQAGGFIVFKLTGKTTMNLADIEMTGLGDARARNWSFELCEKVGIPSSKLPQISNCFNVVGTLTSQAAEELGLCAGIPVVAGTVDISAAALVAGVLSPGQAFIDAGHATNLAVCIDQPLYHKGTIFFGSVLPDKWLIEGASGYTGASMRWFRDVLSINEVEYAERLGINPYTLLDIEAESSPPGAQGVIFVPYLNGALCPIWDPNARGVFFGLSLATGKHDLVRAVMEGCAFDLNLNLEIIESLGARVEELVITGGGAKSRPWNQARADITGKTLKVVTDSGGSVLGAALLAGVGAGLYENPKDAYEHLEQKRVDFFPRPKHAALYRNLYRIYRNIYEKLKDEFRDMRDNAS